MFDVFDQVPPEGISPQELEKLQEHIASIQNKGLSFVEKYLIRWSLTDDRSYEKAPADINQPLGYDFTVIDKTNKRYVCAKSTEGSFDNPFHISSNELLQMREAVAYDLYRVYEITKTNAKLRIARNMKPFAGSVLAIMEQLREGVRPDSVSVLPSVLNFEDFLLLEIPDDEE